MQVYGYVRVSTDEQASEGVSLAAQRTKIDTYCVVRDWHVAGMLEDAGESARDAMAELKAQGKRYCYARFEEHPEALDLLTRTQAQRGQGVSYDAIAQQLDADSVPTISGKGHWQKGTMSHLLQAGTLITVAVIAPLIGWVCVLDVPEEV